MDKVFREKDPTPITHKEFNEFIKGKGFKGRNNYKLRDLTLSGPAFSVVHQARGGGSEARMPKIKVNIN